MSALEMQTEYLTRVRTFAEREGMTEGTHGRVLELWERTLRAIETDNLALVEREIDWVIKWRMIQRYACLLYTSDAADERSSVDLGGRRIIKKKKNKKTQRASNTCIRR
mgnify:CR=1 FL=1